MPKRIKDHRETLIEDLREDLQFAARYMAAALNDSPSVFLQALRDVAEAHRIAKVAEDAGKKRSFGTYQMSNSIQQFEIIKGIAVKVFSCRCGETHRGDYAEETWNHHNCFHGPLWDQGSDEVMCSLCGETFDVESRTHEKPLDG